MMPLASEPWAILADPAVAPLIAEAGPWWLWTADARRLVAANAAAARAMGAPGLAAALARDHAAPGAFAGQIARIAPNLPADGTPRMERLRLYGRFGSESVIARAWRVRRGEASLIAITLPAADRADPRETASGFVRDFSAPAVLFHDSGAPLAASEAAQALAGLGLDALVGAEAESVRREVAQGGSGRVDLVTGPMFLAAVPAARAVVAFAAPGTATPEQGLRLVGGVSAVEGPAGPASAPAPAEAPPPPAAPAPAPATGEETAAGPDPVAAGAEDAASEPAEPAGPDEAAGPPARAEPVAVVPAAEATVDAADTPEPRPAEPPADAAFPADDETSAPEPVPPRFSWRIDAEERFHAVEPASVAALAGLTFAEAARRFAIDPDGRFGAALAAGRPFSGVAAAWPLGERRRLAVTLAAFPSVGGGQTQGYAGFGLVVGELPPAEEAPQARIAAAEEPPAPPAVEEPADACAEPTAKAPETAGAAVAEAGPASPDEGRADAEPEGQASAPTPETSAAPAEDPPLPAACAEAGSADESSVAAAASESAPPEAEAEAAAAEQPALPPPEPSAPAGSAQAAEAGPADSDRPAGQDGEAGDAPATAAPPGEPSAAPADEALPDLAKTESAAGEPAAPEAPAPENPAPGAEAETAAEPPVAAEVLPANPDAEDAPGPAAALEASPEAEAPETSADPAEAASPPTASAEGVSGEPSAAESMPQETGAQPAAEPSLQAGPEPVGAEADRAPPAEAQAAGDSGSSAPDLADAPVPAAEEAAPSAGATEEPATTGAAENALPSAPPQAEPAPAQDGPASFDEEPVPAEEEPVPAEEEPVPAEEEPASAEEEPASAEEEPASAAAAPAPEADASPQGEAGSEGQEAPAPLAPMAEQPPAARAPAEARPVLTVHTNPPNVVALRSTLGQDGRRAGLSPVERNAFREIAKALGAKADPDEPETAAERPAPPTDGGPAPAAAEPPRTEESSTTPDAEPEASAGIAAEAAEPPAAPRPPVEQPAAAPASAPAHADARALLDRVPVGLLVHRGNAVLFVNRTLLDWTGFADAAALEAAGGPSHLFARPPGGADAEPLAIAGADGAPLPVEARLSKLSWAGEPAFLFTLSRTEADTADREAEASALAELRGRLDEVEQILDTATDGIVIVDADGMVESMNRSAEALFGYDAADVQGRHLTLLFAPESHRSVVDYCDGLLSSGVASVLNDGRQVVGRVRQGGLIPLYMTMGRTGPAERPKLAAVFRDMTQWKKAEEDLLAAKRQAEQASTQKSDFLAKISHEIRTPLNAIIGFSEVMMEERFGPVGSQRYRDYLKDIHASGGHVLSLINDLLDLSKIEAGKLDLSFTSVDLNDIVQSTVAIMQPQANRERVIIRSSLLSRLPNVVADARSLRQIVLNLLSNSVKFTPAGGQIIVSTALSEAGEAILRVRDTGVGMTEQELRAAMEPFRQVGTTSPRGAKGTGLGLPLTKALVEANRATFGISSTPNLGTLVEVIFPPTRVLAE